MEKSVRDRLKFSYNNKTEHKIKEDFNNKIDIVLKTEKWR